jgi:hypothetical protein
MLEATKRTIQLTFDHFVFYYFMEAFITSLSCALTASLCAGFRLPDKQYCLFLFLALIVTYVAELTRDALPVDNFKSERFFSAELLMPLFLLLSQKRQLPQPQRFMGIYAIILLVVLEGILLLIFVKNSGALAVDFLIIALAAPISAAYENNYAVLTTGLLMLVCSVTVRFAVANHTRILHGVLLGAALLDQLHSPDVLEEDTDKKHNE